MSLSRVEVARLADVVDALVRRHGDREVAARAIGVGRETLRKIAARPSSLPTTRATLTRIARALGADVTVEALLAGVRVPEVPSARPAMITAGRRVSRRHSNIVRRPSRR